MSFSRLAAALRLAGRLDHAETALKIAFEVAPADLRGDLYRRRAWLRMYQLRLSDALEDARTAEKLSSGQQRVLALSTQGAAHYFMGQYRAAIELYAVAMKQLEPEHESRFCGTLTSYIAALAKGTDDDVQHALALCPNLRARLKPRHKMQRAKLWWCEGLLKERVRDPHGAWWSLDIARRSLIALEAAPEVAGVVADMARVSQQPLAVHHICTEASKVIKTPHPLSEPLRTLGRAAADLIPEAAAALRQAANLIAPCPSL